MKIVTMKYFQIRLRILLLFSLISFLSLNAQQTTEENNYLTNQFLQLNSTEVLLANKVLTITNENQYGLVNLNQIGNNNQIYIRQVGNDAQNISQIGNSNNYQFINYYNNSPSNLNVLQLGNSNSLQVYGENNLIKNMSVVQKTNFKTIIIHNY